MAWLRNTAVGLVSAALLAGAGVSVYVQRSFPVLDGRLSIAGVAAPVAVRRDGSDVTHIEAGSPQDAWFTMGFVHAQERTWQLEFNRRLMRGQLSEVFGAATLETDKLMRALDILGHARKQYEALPPYAREALQAYARGVQAFHAQRSQALPPEFHVLGVQAGNGQVADTWTPEDSVGWTLMMALDLGGNWGNEFARLNLAGVLNTQQLWQLMPPYPGEPPAATADLSALYRRWGVYRQGAEPQGALPAAAGHASMAEGAVSGSMQAWSEALVRDAGTNDGLGSNNWVLDGSRTTTGKPLLANDPHLGLSAPAIWYFAGIKSAAGKAADGTPIPAMDVVGATLPGLPFVVLGRTAGVAWGFTNTNPDVQDLYLEQIDPAHPAQYRTPDGWAPFAVRTETIRVKGQPDQVLSLRSTRHGPVLSDVQKSHAQVLDLSRHVLALRWSALDADNRTVVAGLRANQAGTVGELFAAMADYHSPMQSIVAADTQGRIGYKAAGKVPVRRADNDIRGVAPSPGWDARYDWQGWLSYEQTPEDAGAKGWIATANQRITAPGYPHFLTQDWSLPYRYDRIAKRLAERPQHDLDSMQSVHADVKSLATEKLLPHLRRAQSGHALAPAAQRELARFDGTMDAGLAAPLIFATWVDELTRGVVAARIGEARFAATYGKRDYRAAVEGILDRSDAWWCQPMTCEAQAGEALTRALDRLQTAYGRDVDRWSWGTAHPARSSHRPFGNVAALAPYFDVNVPSHGDSYTVNVGQYNAAEVSGPFVNRHAASLRAVYDLADLERSRFIYQTGQSGLVFSPRYRDMSHTWAQASYRALQLTPARWVHQLELLPPH